MSNEPDQALLLRFVHGDRVAFEALFRAFEHDVHRWIVRIVRDASTADDGVIEAFWRCYRSRARFDPSRSFGGWLRRIATRVAIDLLNVARRHSSICIDEPCEPPCAAAENANTDAIVRAFDSLPTKLRVVAALALIEERPLAEIADALDVPIGTVKSRLFRATRELRASRLHEQPRWSLLDVSLGVAAAVALLLFPERLWLLLHHL
jgi:RNA polymerase sigma-70 factor (ECF subfamily)